MTGPLLRGVFVASLAACGTEVDDRPATLEVVTLTVFAPSCGQVQCHSSTTLTEGYAFDTVEGARTALIDLDIDTAVAADRPLENDLMNVLLADGLDRMPPDSPLAGEDITFVRRWLIAGVLGL